MLCNALGDLPTLPLNAAGHHRQLLHTAGQTKRKPCNSRLQGLVHVDLPNRHHSLVGSIRVELGGLVARSA